MFELSTQRPKSILRLLDNFRNDMNTFDQLFDTMSHFHGMPTLANLPTVAFSPSLEISEKKDSYVATAELPGIDQKDVEITIDEESNTLVLKGEKKQETKQEGDDYFVTERSYGSFRREIYLPKDINKEKIDASFKDGVLKLILPKESKDIKKEAKKISIKTS